MGIVNKKGVSPLVASILLVAIVIVIAFLVFWWYGDYVAENLDKSGITADQACMQDVGFSITNVNCLHNSSDTNKLVYFEKYSDKITAMKREYALKKSPRTYKMDLVSFFENKLE